MKRFLLLLFLVIVIFLRNGLAQDLLTSRQTSYYTYIFKISNEEAAAIYKQQRKNRKREIDLSYFHTLMDSIPTDSLYDKRLPIGHYLKVKTSKDKLECEVASVQHFNAEVLNNSADLQIKIYDTLGNPLPNARVKIRSRSIPFDRKSQSYLLKKSNRKGILEVSHGPLTAYYTLERSYNNSRWKRIKSKVIYGTPLKYAWLPVDIVIKTPTDGYKSIKRGYAQGYIYRIKNFSVNLYEKVACLFDDDYCDSHQKDNKFTQKHSGFLVFNKPKYMPGDTVKFKAFIANKKGKPIKDPVEVYLQVDWKTKKKLCSLEPYSAGGFAYEFLLHDSLDLKLDKTYYVELNKEKERTYLQGSFRYEDYELGKNHLTVRTDGEKHYQGKAYRIQASGKDENDLNLIDARLEITAMSQGAQKYFADHVFVPDTLWKFEIPLNPYGETEITVPDSVFPAANLSYELKVDLFTSDNEKISERKTVQFYHLFEEIGPELSADSITFRYYKNGDSHPIRAGIYGVDHFGNYQPIQEGELPLTLKINPYYSGYWVKTDSLKQLVSISQKPSMLQCLTGRTADSLQVRVENPRKIPFTYFIYKVNREVARGYGLELDYHAKISNFDHYYVSLQYLWGGQVQTENYEIPYNEKQLHVEVDQPQVVYPGQTATVNITVRDHAGKPVPGVDLTAYGLTAKFKYQPPSLPNFSKWKKRRDVFNTFNIDHHEAWHFSRSLPYEQWEAIAGLDSIEYYRFIYPKNEIYTYYYPAADSITQFAPYVMEDGAFIPVHVVYLDRTPVYFSWSTPEQPYSFRATSGYHRVKLRTGNKLFTLDSVYLKPGHKLIFSLNDTLAHPRVKIAKMPLELTEAEKSNLYRYIFPYRHTFGEKYAYLQQGENIISLLPSHSLQSLRHYHAQGAQSKLMTGPVSARTVRFTLLDEYSTYFTPEPYFEHEFSPQLLKMREVNLSNYYPKYFGWKSAVEQIHDEVFTEEMIKAQWQFYLDNKRRNSWRYNNPGSTTLGLGKLEIKWVRRGKTEQTPLNVLVFKNDDADFLRVYQGSATTFHNLLPGTYKLICLYEDQGYSIVDSLRVQKDGLSHYQLQRPEVQQKDVFSMKVNQLMEMHIMESNHLTLREFNEKKAIQNLYRQQFEYSGSGELIEGYIYDDMGEPLPGVNVIIKGTTFGTVSDINGFYSIKAPPNATLTYSFVGFMQEEVRAGVSTQDIRLQPDVTALSEVVVIGYGEQRKKSITATMAVVNVDVPGTLQGKAPGVVVRGVNSLDAEASPLVVIDGVIHLGKYDDIDPNLIGGVEVLKDESLVAIYGARAANGVIMINTKAGADYKATGSLKGIQAEQSFLEAAAQASAIRNNFSDYAYWQPSLMTDNHGRASFQVTFPDDVTQWKTYVLAINGRRQTGQTEQGVKAFKPLMAQLNLPRFMTTGDTCYAIGKSLNYTADTLIISTHFEVDGREVFAKNQAIGNAVIDTLTLIAGATDSLRAKYFLEKPDGYFDGEMRDIPVYPVGIESTAGQFFALDQDTTIHLSFTDSLGEVTLYAEANVLNVMRGELRKLMHYQYDCNEQMASKLKAYLAGEKIRSGMGETSLYRQQINRLIKRLADNQNDEGMWGWWNKSDTHLWISYHVIEALMEAKREGYSVTINMETVKNTVVWRLESGAKHWEKADLLFMAKMLGMESLDYQRHIKELDTVKWSSLTQEFRFIELKQLCGMEYDVEVIRSHRKETLFGNYFFSEWDARNRFSLTQNDVAATLTAYRVLRNDSATGETDLSKIRNYFLENHGHTTFRNTYESARILETILPDLLKGKEEAQKPVLLVSGDVNESVTEFPYELKFSADRQISISKKGDFPVYLTAYQRYFNTAPTADSRDFVIHTRFKDQGDSLVAGKSVKMIVEVTVLKDAEYLMIEAPIPAGCSYEKKIGRHWNEAHREYFRHKVSIFSNRLERGNYTFEIDLLPRYSGSYTLNPAKAELMYFPTFFGNNAVRKVVVE